MSAPKVAEEVRQACRIHARLLDSFIEMTSAELMKLQPGFVEESLKEALEKMRAARKAYGSLSGVEIVADAANAA